MTHTPSDFYPALYFAADRASQKYQRQHLGLIKMILSFAVVIAVANTLLPEADSFLNTVAFLGLLLTLAAQAAWKPSQRWYASRALAESVKSLTWRFAIHGEPFVESQDATRIEKTFLDSLRLSTESVHELDLALMPGVQQLNPGLIACREFGFADRRASYLQGRLEPQFSWYVAKARYHSRRSSIYTAALITLAVLGLAGSLWQLTDPSDFDPSSPIAALGTAALSYLNVRQHSVLARSYRLTSHELSLIISSAAHVDEKSWGEFVDSAEGAISREHTMWSASRGFLPPNVR